MSVRIDSNSRRLPDLAILVRGAGEMATATAWRLHRAGFFRILMTEVDCPLAVRRLVSFCEAVHYASWTVEGVAAARVSHLDELERVWQRRAVGVIVDPDNESRKSLKPDVEVDAILAKKNTGTARDDASLVIGLGPGFYAGRDVHYVVETNRGHDLGRLISNGEASPNTGVPGDIAGKSVERVLRAPSDGIFESHCEIGTMVRVGDSVGEVAGSPVKTGLEGVLRGLIRPGTAVTCGLKIGDVDPRGIPAYCSTISEKARAIAGTVLEALLMEFNTNQDAIR
jgi:xanthine dehydrogenase accessory factor